MLTAEDQCLFTRNYQANMLKNPAEILYAVLRHKHSPNIKLDMGQYLDGQICCFYPMKARRNWYEHYPNPVTKRGSITILWRFTMYTERTIIVIKDNKTRMCFPINMAVPVDRNIDLKTLKKIIKVQRSWRGNINNVAYEGINKANFVLFYDISH